MAIMAVRMSTTKLEAKPSRTSGDFECGLACNNVKEASRLIGEGAASLRLSVYPWGAEFDVVPNGSDNEAMEEDSSNEL